MTTDGYNVGQTTTEWHDALVKHKIIARPERVASQEEGDLKHMWEARDEEQSKKYENKTLSELQEMEDQGDEQTIEQLRRKRLQELKEKDAADRFGRIQVISKADYTREVTDASKQVIVICCLFAYSQPESKRMLQCLEVVAERFKECKFVKIKGQECIESYPEEYCPTLIIYKNENPIGHIKGLQCFGGLDVVSPDVLEWELAQIGVWKTHLESNPRTFQLHTKSKRERRRFESKISTEGGGDVDADEDENDEKEDAAQRDSDLSDLDLD